MRFALCKWAVQLMLASRNVRTKVTTWQEMREMLTHAYTLECTENPGLSCYRSQLETGLIIDVSKIAIN